MPTLIVAADGKVTLTPELMLHLGIEAGSSLSAETLPDGSVKLRGNGPDATLEAFFTARDNTPRHAPPLGIDDINHLTSAGWAGRLKED
ncbi:hypothetical protein SAMN05880582_101880 [Rhizobium sp. RU20A]|nr:hypothetical protein SAMN05880582_101880 [Rhizobium sp. RU20A]